MPAPGSRWRFVADERHAAPVVGAHGAAEGPADQGRRLSRREVAGEEAALDDRLASRGRALVVPAERAEAERRRRVGGDVHVLGAVAEAAEVARLEEARARVGGFGAVDAVELGRVADRLVHLEHHLLGVDDDRRDSRWARVGSEERSRLLPTRGASRSRPRASTNSQPACPLEPPWALG